MPVFQGIDTQTRERCFTGNFEEDREAGRELGRTAICQKFRTDFEFDAENLQLILDTARVLNNDPQYVTVSMAEHALTLLVNRAPSLDKWTPGKLRRKAPEPAAPVVEPPQPPIHRGQELWRSHAEFMKHGGKDGGEPTMDEVRAHARESASFRAYVQQAYRKEMAQPVDACEVLNRRTESPERKPTPELEEFANTYHRLSCDEIRRLRRADSNPYGFKEWNKKVEACCEAGLI